MNSFNKNNISLFILLLGIVLNNALHGVTCRNEPLTNFIQPGETLYANFPENSIIILEIENENFDVRENNISVLSNIEEIFHEVKNNRGGASFSSKFLNMSGNSFNYNSSCLQAHESITLQAKTSLNFDHCLFESPLISITGNQMNFIDSFLINPNILNVIIDHPESDYDFIQFIFYDQPENPTIITGEIDLKNNQPKKLIISNVKEIRIHFMWDKNLPRKSNSNPKSDFDSIFASLNKTSPNTTEAISNSHKNHDSAKANSNIMLQKSEDMLTNADSQLSYNNNAEFLDNIIEFSKPLIPAAIIAALTLLCNGHHLFSN